MKTAVILLVCVFGAVAALEDALNREKRQARWGQSRGLFDWMHHRDINHYPGHHDMRNHHPPSLNHVPNQHVPNNQAPTNQAPNQRALMNPSRDIASLRQRTTWAPTTSATDSGFGQFWGVTQPTSPPRPSSPSSSRSRNSMGAPSPFRPPPPRHFPEPPGWSRSPHPPLNHSLPPPPHGNHMPPRHGPPTAREPPYRRHGSHGEHSPSWGRRPAPDRPLSRVPSPTAPPPLAPARPPRKHRPRNNRFSSTVPASLLQGLGPLLAAKLRANWLNPLYQQQAKAAGDNFVINAAPVRIGYKSCPRGIFLEHCVYNPCPNCRDTFIECWTNPCGGCSAEMYVSGKRIYDCEQI